MTTKTLAEERDLVRRRLVRHCNTLEAMTVGERTPEVEEELARFAKMLDAYDKPEASQT